MRSQFVLIVGGFTLATALLVAAAHFLGMVGLVDVLRLSGLALLVVAFHFSRRGVEPEPYVAGRLALAFGVILAFADKEPALLAAICLAIATVSAFTTAWELGHMARLRATVRPHYPFLSIWCALFGGSMFVLLLPHWGEDKLWFIGVPAVLFGAALLLARVPNRKRLQGRRNPRRSRSKRM